MVSRTVLKSISFWQPKRELTVRNKVRTERGLLLIVASASVLLTTQAAWADGTDTVPRGTDDSGFSALSNATNVTRWGLGVGAGIGESPYKGYGTKFVPIPMFFFDDKWVHALGTTLDVKIGTWYGVHVMLRGKYSVGDGYKGSDASSLNGMEKRHGGFWYGPALAWQTPFGTLSGDFLTAGNKGQQAHINFAKRFDVGRISVEPHVGAEWLGHKYVDYYYGVRPGEVRADRPGYTGTASYVISAGVQLGYKLTQRQAVSLDLGALHLGSGITDSPIVGKRYIPGVRIGYLYHFE